MDFNGNRKGFSFMAENALLSIRGLSASVDEKQILHSIDLDVPQGEVHVLMGPNGAGKSTLGHVAMGEPVLLFYNIYGFISIISSKSPKKNYRFIWSYYNHFRKRYYYAFFFFAILR